MNCYFCVQHRPGGTNYDIRTAIGVCKHCSVGVCEAHGQKRVGPGEPLLCLICAELLASNNIQKQGVRTQTDPERQAHGRAGCTRTHNAGTAPQYYCQKEMLRRC